MIKRVMVWLCIFRTPDRDSDRGITIPAAEGGTGGIHRHQRRGAEGVNQRQAPWTGAPKVNINIEQIPIQDYKW